MGKKLGHGSKSVQHALSCVAANIKQRAQAVSGIASELVHLPIANSTWSERDGKSIPTADCAPFLTFLGAVPRVAASAARLQFRVGATGAGAVVACVAAKDPER